MTDYETMALARKLEVITIERQINEDKILLSVELGLGPQKMRLALGQRTPL